MKFREDRGTIRCTPIVWGRIKWVEKLPQSIISKGETCTSDCCQSPETNGRTSPQHYARRNKKTAGQFGWEHYQFYDVNRL